MLRGDLESVYRNYSTHKQENDDRGSVCVHWVLPWARQLLPTILLGMCHLFLTTVLGGNAVTYIPVVETPKKETLAHSGVAARVGVRCMWAPSVQLQGLQCSALSISRLSMHFPLWPLIQLGCCLPASLLPFQGSHTGRRLGGSSCWRWACCHPASHPERPAPLPTPVTEMYLMRRDLSSCGSWDNMGRIRILPLEVYCVKKQKLVRLEGPLVYWFPSG